jgi:hypothetical protein
MRFSIESVVFALGVISSVEATDSFSGFKNSGTAHMSHIKDEVQVERLVIRLEGGRGEQGGLEKIHKDLVRRYMKLIHNNILSGAEELSVPVQVGIHAGIDKEGFYFVPCNNDDGVFIGSYRTSIPEIINHEDQYWTFKVCQTISQIRDGLMLGGQMPVSHHDPDLG